MASAFRPTFVRLPSAFSTFGAPSKHLPAPFAATLATCGESLAAFRPPCASRTEPPWPITRNLGVGVLGHLQTFGNVPDVPGFALDVLSAQTGRRRLHPNCLSRGTIGLIAARCWSVSLLSHAAVTRLAKPLSLTFIELGTSSSRATYAKRLPFRLQPRGVGLLLRRCLPIRLLLTGAPCKPHPAASPTHRRARPSVSCHNHTSGGDSRLRRKRGGRRQG